MHALCSNKKIICHKMKIARVVHNYYPFGDPAKTHELSLRQAERGNYVRVFTTDGHEESFYELVKPNYEIVRLQGISFTVKNLITRYPYLPTLPKVLKATSFDVLHAHSHLFLTTAQAVKIAKDVKKPVIVSVHGVSAQREFLTNLAQRTYLFSMGSWIFKNATRVICLTSSDAKEICRYGCNPNKIRVIPTGVDLHLFRPSKIEENYIFWAGRFVPEKGLRYLIDVAELIFKEKTYVKFLLAGDGLQMAEIMARAMKRRLNNTMVFLGRKARKKIAFLMSRCLLFCFPSIKEGLPMAVQEAMACGKPIVAFNIPGMMETVQKSGVLVRPYDVNEMAKAIIHLIENRNLRKKLGANARSMASRMYDWNTVIDRMERIYQDAINSPSS